MKRVVVFFVSLSLFYFWRLILFVCFCYLYAEQRASVSSDGQVDLTSGCSLGQDWRRQPGRPRASWTDQLRHDTGLDLSLPTSGERPLCGVVVEWHERPSWLRDDDDNDDRPPSIATITSRLVVPVVVIFCATMWSDHESVRPRPSSCPRSTMTHAFSSVNCMAKELYQRYQRS